MTEYNPVGKCLFCNAEFPKSGISRHLNKHLSQQVKELKPGISYHVKIEPDYRGGSPYFLNLWVDGNAQMRDVDHFLRAIWLECCGHLSSFTLPKQRKTLWMFDEDEMMSEIDEIMNSRTSGILTKGMKLKYEYDFGSTTELLLTVVDMFNVKSPENITLLSRNEPLEIMCDDCGSEPASQICTACYEENFFCKKCAKKHAQTCEDFADYSAMPVVNSPRMGVCGYEGGTIDKNRDGIFVKK